MLLGEQCSGHLWIGCVISSLLALGLELGLHLNLLGRVLLADALGTNLRLFIALEADFDQSGKLFGDFKLVLVQQLGLFNQTLLERGWRKRLIFTLYDLEVRRRRDSRLLLAFINGHFLRLNLRCSPGRHNF